MWKTIKENKDIRNLFTLFCVLISGFLQAAVIRVFMEPLNLLSSGFTGLAILIERITSSFFGFTFSTSLGMLILNIPVAFLCSRSISKRFVFFSMIQVFTVSLCLKVMHFNPFVEKAGYSFGYSKQDYIVRYFIENERYDIFEINYFLMNEDLPYLGSKYE